MTPIRRQYLDVKRRHPGAIVLFRLGDFYETFDDDAELVARELRLTLTSRPLGKGERIPMAGIPHHALGGYLARLIAGGHRVAICEQTGEASGRGPMQREVTRVVSPGTVLGDDLLRGAAANYLAACVAEGERAGLAWADVSTGEFATCQLEGTALEAELARLAPAELLLPDDAEPPLETGAALSRRRRPHDPARTLREHLGVATLEAFGCAALPLAVEAAALLVSYLVETQPAVAAQLTALRTESADTAMLLDAATRRNLELYESARGGERAHSLAAVLDRTCTPMGARLLRTQLGRPLRGVSQIEARLDAVEALLERPLLRADVRERLRQTPDIERIVTRCAVGSGAPRELAALRRGLLAVAELSELLTASFPEGDPGPLPALPDCAEVAAVIGEALADDPPATLDAGGVIRPGYNVELDETRALARDSRAVLAALEQRERERSGIRSLRVTYNRVFGYAIEVSSANLHLVPADYQRRQTLASGERFVTPELKELEARILGAEERLGQLEGGLFRALCAAVAAHAARLKALGAALAALDVAASHAETAAVAGYCRPRIDESDRIEVREGRHPVVEHVLPPGSFVPNDTELSAEAQIVVLTGPNMAGKSTYLRQLALIVLLAQAGSFVPARAARIGLCDRIFTRIGAQDDLAAGSSTFMVEMTETAQILHHATPRSLVILDEVGRGTSTYDGLALARAVVEYLHNQRDVAARTLFATHYHELTELAGVLPRVRNATVAVAEEDGQLVFLRRVVPGGADRSYGIHVAQLAGMPRAVVQRAAELLVELETRRNSMRTAARGRRARQGEGQQLGLFSEPPPLLRELAELEIDALSPLEALTRLYELRERARAL